MDRPSLETLIGKKNLVGAEIGVAAGVNALEMLKGLDIKKLFLIDPYLKFKGGPKDSQVMHTPGTKKRGFAETQMKPFKDKVEFIFDISANAADLIEEDSLDFVYIDGNHATEHVAEDITLYLPKVKKGGLVAGHDYDVKSVRKGVDRVLKNVNTEKCRKIDVQKDWWVIKEGGADE